MRFIDPLFTFNPRAPVFWCVIFLITGCGSRAFPQEQPQTLPPGPSVPGIVVPVWPEGKMPGHGANLPEGALPSKDAIERLTNISQPMLTVYQAPHTTGPVPALVICPGGGYRELAYNLEGTEIAAWINSLGMTAILLKYRVPGNPEGAYQDLQRAVRLARAHARDWNILPDKLGVIGFSAGGHLTARLSNNFSQSSYPAIDAADALSCRPDFVVLVYPAYLAVKGNLSLDPRMTVTANTPPTLIVHVEDDRAYEPGSKLYDAALTAANVPHAFLLYREGGHGWGLRSKKEVKVWPIDAANWLRKTAILK